MRMLAMVLDEIAVAGTALPSRGKTRSTVDRHAAAMSTPGDRAHGRIGYENPVPNSPNGLHSSAQDLPKGASATLSMIERNNAHAQVFAIVAAFLLAEVGAWTAAPAQAAISEPDLYAFDHANADDCGRCARNCAVTA